MAAIEWFAQLCDSLSTNPGQATQLLTEFRESEVALESCKLFLQYPEINVNVLFQASLTLQYSFLKHWNSIQPVYKEELEQVILYLLQQKCGQENATSFALNKLMQLYALIWKHGWADSNEQQHSILFEKISLFLNQDNKQFIQCGLVFLKIIVEDFCNRGGSQVSLPVAIHNSIRVSFENDGLDQCLKLSLDWLSKCLAIVRQASFVITSPGSDLTGHQQTLALLRDALKLTNELLSWEFSAFTESGSSMLPSQSGSALFSAPSHNNSHGRDDNRFGGSVGRTMITLPASWTAYFVQSSLQQEVVQAYSAVKESLHQVVLVDLNFARDRNQTYQQTMFELRQLMANLAAINGKFADNTADKLQLASLLCNYMLPLVSQAYDGSITVGIEADTPAYSILTELEMTERQAFSSLFLTFIDNFQLANLASLPNFLDIVSLLAGMTRTTASSITQQYRSSGAGASSLSGSMIDGLDGAQGDTLTQLLEAWSILLTSPWMMSNYLLIDPMTNKPVLTEGSTQELALTLTHEKIIVQQLKLLLLQSAEPLFSELYGLMICSVIHDLVSSEGEEEEEEEVEALYMTSVHDLMSGICTVGRSSFPSTYHFVTQSLTASLGQCQVALQQSNGVLSVDIIKNPTYILECRKVLESIRINILFMSHLLSDNYVTETNGNSQSNNSNSNVISSSETPLIPVFIIDACLLNGGTIYNIYQGLTQVCEVINFQLNLMSLASSSDSSGRTMSCSGQSHPLFSPLILQLSVQLLSLYLKRYINIDAGFYDSTLILVISDINTAHRNEQFNDLLSLCARAAYQCVYQLPHERDLIEATSELIDTVAVSLAYPRYASATILNLSSPRGKSSVQDISYFISLTDVSSLYTLLTTSEYLSLGFESIAELFKSISMLVVSASSKVLCEQICTALHGQFQSIHTSMVTYQQAPRNAESEQLLVMIRNQAARTLAGLRGLTKCQFRGELDKITNALFECCLPLVYQLLQVFREHDDVSRECMLLLRDTAEVQLPSMGAGTARALYITSLEAFRNFSLRFHPSQPSSSTGTTECVDSFESEFRSDILLNCLELLNHLVTKDLQLDDDLLVTSSLLQPATSQSTLSLSGTTLAVSSASLIPEVLLTGLEIVLSVVTPDLLKNYPRTTDRYFTFLTLLTSAYERELAERVNRSIREAAMSGRTGSNMLALMTQHMLWAAGAIDSSAARLALQSLQWLGTYQYRSTQNGCEGFGQQSLTLFHTAQCRLMEILVMPRSSEYGLTMDRLEAYGNSLAVLIAIDPGQFQQSCHALISKHPPAIQGALGTYFTKFLDPTAYEFTNITKGNRIVFVRRFRLFVMELRSIVLFA